MRMLSAIKDERVRALRILQGPSPHFQADRTEFLEALREALYCSNMPPRVSTSFARRMKPTTGI